MSGKYMGIPMKFNQIDLDQFYPDTIKQAQEVICSRKTNKVYHYPLIFNHSTVTQTLSQQQLSVVLDSRLMILVGEKQSQIKLHRLRNVRIWTLR